MFRLISNRGSLLGRLRQFFKLVAGWRSCEILFANVAASLMLPDCDLVSGSPIGNFIHYSYVLLQRNVAPGSQHTVPLRIFLCTYAVHELYVLTCSWENWCLGYQFELLEGVKLFPVLRMLGVINFLS